jgi:hypothetical protein
MLLSKLSAGPLLAFDWNGMLELHQDSEKLQAHCAGRIPRCNRHQTSGAKQRRSILGVMKDSLACLVDLGGSHRCIISPQGALLCDEQRAAAAHNLIF